MNGTVAKDQNVVAKGFAGYFSTFANDIGGKSSLSSTEDDFTAIQVSQTLKTTGLLLIRSHLQRSLKTKLLKPQMVLILQSPLVPT